MTAPATARRRCVRSRRRVAVAIAVIGLLAGGCAGGASRAPREEAVRSAGSTPVVLTFLTSYENVPSASYYPLDGIAGCCFGPDGTLLVCDEKRGVVHALDPRNLDWYEFDAPPMRPYQPIDAAYDGLKVLVLDRAGSAVQRYEVPGWTSWSTCASSIPAITRWRMRWPSTATAACSSPTALRNRS